MKKIGLFGGTFDPIHNGHIQLARHALSKCQLDKILFIPTSNPPHKLITQPISYRERVEMISLALADLPKFSVSLLEKDRGEYCYTIDTLHDLLKNNLEQVDYHFIIGVDAFYEIESWKKGLEVLSKVHFIVAARQGYDVAFFRQMLHKFGYTKNLDHWENHLTHKNIYLIKDTIPDISSSSIRKKIQSNQLCGEDIPLNVQRYIVEKNLYKDR